MDIESILANRAKNPWLDTGYALLSYLLTCKSIFSGSQCISLGLIRVICSVCLARMDHHLCIKMGSYSDLVSPETVAYI